MILLILVFIGIKFDDLMNEMMLFDDLMNKMIYEFDNMILLILCVIRICILMNIYFCELI